MDQAQNLRNIIKQKNMEQVKQAQVITVTSGKGGVGKTSLSVNLAVEFRKRGKSVIIFDADFGLANIEVMFGAIPKYNLSDVIFRGKSMEEIIVKGPMDIGFISGGSGITGLGNLTQDQVNFLIYKLKVLEGMADVIIVDTGAGISDSVIGFVASSSEVMIVTTPEPTSITDAYALLKVLNSRSGFEKESTKIKLIANRVSNYEEGKNLYNKLKLVVDKFLGIELDFLGVVSSDNNISKAIMQQKPITIAYPNSQASRDFSLLADGILKGENVESSGNGGIAAAVLRIFRGKTTETYRK